MAPSRGPGKHRAIDAGAVRPSGGGGDLDRRDHLRAGLLAGGDPHSPLGVRFASLRRNIVPAAMGWPPEIGETLPRAADAWCAEEKWIAWIMADHGHHSEWLTVLRVGVGEWERAWEALREAVKEATIATVRLPATGGVGCGVTVDASIGERSAPVTSAWHYAMQGAAPRPPGWSPPTRRRTFGCMAVTDELAIGKLVERRSPSKGHPSVRRAG